MSEVSAEEALRPALDALRRGTKRSRLRMFVAVCKSGHTLLEVFPTRAGPVALWEERGNSSTRKAWQMSFIPQPPLPDDGGWVPTVSHGGTAWPACRCTKVTLIHFDWLEEQLDAGTTRAVAQA